PWQHHDSGAETQPARARSDPSQEIERGRHLTVAGEVVLHDERAVKAQRLRLDVVVDEIAKSLAAVEFRTTAPRRRTAEQAESHVVVLPNGSYQLLARYNRPSKSHQTSRKAHENRGDSRLRGRLSHDARLPAAAGARRRRSHRRLHGPGARRRAGGRLRG